MSLITKTEVKREFKAMGSDFEIICAASDLHLVSEIENYAHYLQSIWTRFSDASELMQLNFNAGNSQIVSPETSQLVSQMKRGFELTGGLYNAGVLPLMLQQGFMSPNSRFQKLLAPKNYAELWNAVEINELQVKLPKGLAIDAGGIGKGLAADLMAQKAMAKGAIGIVINAGGEVAVRGDSVTTEGWSVAVESPFIEDHLLSTVFLQSGGLATSAPSGRMIQENSHIIDPRTQTSIRTEIAQATVLAAQTVDCEVLAKMCLLLPVADSLKRIEDLGAAAFVLTNNEITFQTANWEDFT